MNRYQDHIQWKMGRIVFGMFIAISIIGIRLVYLQVIKHRALLTQSQRNYMRIEKIHSPRGSILDRNGILMATNRPSTDLFWQGTGSRRLTENHLNTLQIIASIMGDNWLVSIDLLRDIAYSERYQQELLIAKDLSFEQLCQVLEQLADNRNVRLATQFKRFYPYKSIASHVIGYLGCMNLDYFGKMGIEKIFEDDLRGREGTKVKTINSFGARMSETQTQEVIAGKDINTTIDLRMQILAESLFGEHQQGVLIAMDPFDGDLLAIVSRPNFDPEFFLQRFLEDQWLELQEKQPFLNRAFNALYPPGSIFKLIVASAALETGVITPNTTCFCKGYSIHFGRKHCCAYKFGHGTLTANKAVAHSCNILFYDIGRRIHIDTIADYAHRFGLGEKTGSAFAEKEGIIPSTKWKRAALHQRWWPGETLCVAIGQSYLLVTPIQIARMIGSIFTRQLVAPRITLDMPIEKRPLEIRPDTLNFLKQSMHMAADIGTARRLCNIKNTSIYSKTSTAQVCALQKTSLGTKYMEHGWVAVYAQYKHYKPIILIILVEHAGSSTIPTTLAKYFIQEYQKILDDPQYMPTITKIEHQEDPESIASQSEEESAQAEKEKTETESILAALEKFKQSQANQPSPETEQTENIELQEKFLQNQPSENSLNYFN